jgi:hypothetical protein
MEEKISVSSERVKGTFWASLKEVRDTVTRKRKPTDVTKTALVFIGVASRIYSAEVHERAIDLLREKWDKNPELMKMIAK